VVPEDAVVILRFIRNTFSARAASRGVVLRDNGGLVNTGVIKGSVVVVNGERYAFSVSIPWVRSPELENVGSLLTWQSRVPRKLYGRDAEFEELHRWASKTTGKEAADIRVRVLYGDGGAGKTRLAFELAERLGKQGWHAGQVTDPTRPVVFPMSKPGVLLIFDYPELFPKAVSEFLELIKRSNLPGLRLRVLFLCRNAQAMTSIIDAKVEAYHSTAMALEPLASDEIAWALFNDAWQEMRRLRQGSGSLQLTKAQFKTWLQRSPSHAQPLIILCFALNLLYDPSAIDLGRTKILERLAARERNRLAGEMEKYQLQKEGALLLKALSAIPGRLTAADVNDLHAQLAHPGIQLPTAVELQRTSVWQDDMLEELQPDLLASVFLHGVIAQWLSDLTAAGPWIWAFLNIGTPSHSELRGRLGRIARLSVDRPRSDTDMAVANPIVEALAQLVDRDEDKAVVINDILNKTTQLEWTLPLLALSAARSVVRIHEKLAKENFALYAPDLASSLNNLSVRLPESGDRAGGLAAIHRAVDLYEALAKENFAVYAPYLATSLNNLSVSLSGSGNRAGALAAIRLAVDLYEALAKENFAVYAPGLARSLNNLSVDLAGSDDRAGGLAAIRRAVDLYEALAKENFTVYAPDLASSLNNLSVDLAGCGDRVGGLATIRRAVEIREALTKENFALYAPDLARSLYVLSLQLNAGGDCARDAAEILERAIGMIRSFVLPNTAHSDLYERMKATLLAIQE
jgi:hypothetical protein